VCPPYEITNKYKEEVSLMREYAHSAKLFYIVGNHDWQIWEALADLDIDALYLIEYYDWRTKTLYVHGHQFDPLLRMNPIVYKSWLAFGTYLEQLNRLLRPLWTQLIDPILNSVNINSRETIGSKVRALEKGDQSKVHEVSQLMSAFRQNAQEYREKRGVGKIIHGHTHRSLISLSEIDSGTFLKKEIVTYTDEEKQFIKYVLS